MIKNIISSALAISLLGSSVSALAHAPVPETIIQFKNEDSANLPITSTMPPYLDNFSWADLNPDYKANWIFTNPPSKKSFKEADKITIAAGQSISADVSYSWKVNWYGMSQYAFNYENYPKEYGCFVTELRLSSRWYSDKRIAIASYRYDPQHSDNYLTCSVEKVSDTSFTVHMRSSQTKKEDNKLEDSNRYSEAGDTKELNNLSYYTIDLPIELWKDSANNLAFVLSNNKALPVITKPEQPFQHLPKYITTIQLINNTTQVLLAGQPLLDKFSRLSKEYYLQQPQQLQPGSISTIHLSINEYSNYAFIRLNYHFANYAEDSGCYITSYLKNKNAPSWFATIYRFDSKHPAPEKNLYCFITRNQSDDLEKITVSFYENHPTTSLDDQDSVMLRPSRNPYASYSRIEDVGINMGLYVRIPPFYDHGEFLNNKSSRDFIYGLDFPVDPTHHLILRPD